MRKKETYNRGHLQNADARRHEGVEGHVEAETSETNQEEGVERGAPLRKMRETRSKVSESKRYTCKLNGISNLPIAPRRHRIGLGRASSGVA